MPAGLRFSLLYAALFFELGVNLPFFPVWLRSQHLDDGRIGIILAMPLLARVVANPLVTAVADRQERLSGTLLTCAAAVAIGTPLLGATTTFLPILLLVAAIGLAQGPLIALADAVTLRATRTAVPVDYGRVRLWGSIAFAMANIAGGMLLIWFEPDMIIWLLTASAWLTALTALTVARLPSTQQSERQAFRASGSVGRLIVLVVIGAACVQASHGLIYAFGTLHWQSAGIGTGTTGMLWALGVVSEIAVFAIAGRLVGNARAAMFLLLSGAAVAAGRWLCMAFDPNVELLAVLQLTHGFTFGATHVGSIVVLAQLAAPAMQAQVQGWLAGAWAGLMALLTALCGQVYAGWGERTYLFMAGVAATGMVLIGLAALSASRRSLALQAPQKMTEPLNRLE
ncbi:PPP family 3-phenylpropionic acid transporter [Aminobacter aminovorans]|uniref:Probable 3-phenylpropionic acid transporter n=1 Tax=Aminobacter aminovorans TaxID=83263 RepID=A0A381IL33_AMIAI|nr:MFS transporter [Aminobacter aminovorans]TCS24963.1 PPP family 3-phenylpropionic acid transporter [Aminobacter aminovorans]SUY28635.1 Probable 3-phenylpropionic acid transporter [Aminobacter aminovorans]